MTTTKQTYGVIPVTNKSWQRFSSRLSAPDQRGCIIWPRPEGYGYGRFYFGTLKYPAHRMAWIFRNGPIPNGLFVCHKCDVRLCVNPNHLFLGTHSDNMKDMIRKGRNKRSLAALKGRRGEASSQAKLSEVGAREVLDNFQSGKTIAQISRDFGMSRTAIEALVRGRTWKHLALPNPPSAPESAA